MDQDPNNCFLPIHSSRISWGPWELLPALTPRRRLKAPGLGDPHHPRRASGNSSGSGFGLPVTSSLTMAQPSSPR
ncbi:uncharacterized protein LOC117075477 isoform X2 [Trachypithecus francoisi]|uniref:uncharacterized protein LOC117075477 isoform X2 n=1 Tax=Trachypithecus francoisi TaxID=54180 RepID=UPI00141BEA85|nr:uncharacterized protein LOC117075477 isoform X2 [Trachypithecus francoisi]